MAGQNCFDIVSQIELPEVQNAVALANKEVTIRYDLKTTNSSIDFDSSGPKLTIRSQDEYTLKQVIDVLETCLVRRKVPIKSLSYGSMEAAAGSSVRQEVELQVGITVEKARSIVKKIKELKLKKVQASIQGDQVRVSGPKRDDLQAAMAALKDHDFGIDMQFVNYR